MELCVYERLHQLHTSRATAIGNKENGDAWFYAWFAIRGLKRCQDFVTQYREVLHMRYPTLTHAEGWGSWLSTNHSFKTDHEKVEAIDMHGLYVHVTITRTVYDSRFTEQEKKQIRAIACRKTGAILAQEYVYMLVKDQKESTRWICDGVTMPVWRRRLCEKVLRNAGIL